MTGGKVYQAINKVSEGLCKIGIAKDQRNSQGTGYMFRGIDSVYNALAPLLAGHGLCIIPRMIARDCVERTSAAGKALFYIVVEAEFDFISTEDGSMHTARTFGEAMDSGDKGTNKAMSAAYKYAAFQAFCIPTEGDNDTENQTHEVMSKFQTAPKPASNPAKNLSWFTSSVKNECKSLAELTAWWKDNEVEIKKLSVKDQTAIKTICGDLKKKFVPPTQMTTDVDPQIKVIICPETDEEVFKPETCIGKPCSQGCPEYAEDER
jgi:hypothetical protein